MAADRPPIPTPEQLKAMIDELLASGRAFKGMTVDTPEGPIFLKEVPPELMNRPKVRQAIAEEMLRYWRTGELPDDVITVDDP